MALKFLCAHCNKIVITRYLRPGEQSECRACGGLSIVPENALAASDQEYFNWTRGATTQSAPGTEAPSPGAGQQQTVNAQRPAPDYLETAPEVDQSLMGDIRGRSAFDYLNYGWESLKPFFGLGIGGLVVYWLVSVVGAFIPIVNWFYGLFVGSALSGGIAYFYLNIARNTNPRIEDIFAGFRRYLKLLGIQLTMVFAMLLLYLPLMIAFVLVVGLDSLPGTVEGMEVELEGLPVMMLVAGGGMIVIGLLLLMALFAFVYPIAMDHPDLDVFSCFTRSYKLVSPHFLKVLLFFVVAFVIGFAAALMCLLPLLAAIPFLQVSFMRLYMDLKADFERTQAGIQAA